MNAFRAAWLVWRLAVYVGAFAYTALPGHYWTVVWGVFLPLEAWGVLRPEKEDTLSETHWMFGRRGAAWRVWSLAHAVLYGWLAAVYPSVWGIEPSVPWIIFTCGLAGWLAVHFVLLGKQG